MAWLGAGRDSDVERIAAACRNGGNEGAEAARWARRTGLPLVAAFAACWHRAYATAVDRLHGARPLVHGFAGRPAQRDTNDWHPTEAAPPRGTGAEAEQRANDSHP